MRAELIEAAEQLIREQGYPAVTSRTLADKVNLKRQIVHYYFKSMDEVFIAVIHRSTERMKARIEEVRASDEPLRALQRLNQDADEAILSVELSALGNRRPAVRAEVARATEELRELQTQILEEVLARRDMPRLMSPKVAIVLLTSLAQVLAVEEAIDVTSGHPETLEFIEQCLRAFAEDRQGPFQQPAGAALADG